MNLRDQSFALDRQRIATNALLARSRSILATIGELHMVSVQIGRFEAVGDSGAISGEIRKAREIMEVADLLQADIDKLINEGTK
jgi:hypothetical protein